MYIYSTCIYSHARLCIKIYIIRMKKRVSKADNRHTFWVDELPYTLYGKEAKKVLTMGYNKNKNSEK